MRRALMVLSAGVFGALVMAGIALSAGSFRAARPVHVPPAPPPDADVEQKLGQLERELRSLKQDRRVVLAAGRSDEQAAGPGLPEARLRTRSEPERDAREEAQVEQERFEALDAHFQTEERDAAWARDTESAILSKAEDPRFAGFALTRARCAATLCKVEAAANTADALVPVHDLFQVVPRERFAGVRVRRIGAPNGNRVVAYYVRKGHALPETD